MLQEIKKTHCIPGGENKGSKSRIDNNLMSKLCYEINFSNDLPQQPDDSKWLIITDTLTLFVAKLQRWGIQILGHSDTLILQSSMRNAFKSPLSCFLIRIHVCVCVRVRMRVYVCMRAAMAASANKYKSLSFDRLQELLAPLWEESFRQCR